MKETYINVTQENGKRFMERNIAGHFTMLNLLKFKKRADYSQFPDLAPEENVTGAQAYDQYINAVLPLLQANGSSLIFKGKGGSFTIGPSDESWDLVLLVRHRSVHDFLSFAQNKAYLAIAGHRNAALQDARLLALVE